MFKGKLMHFRAEPTEFARVTVNGKVTKQGEGIACWYFPFRTSFELVPTTAVDQAFTFRETSIDNQEVNLQGGFVYRVTEPSLVLAHYNHAIDPESRDYRSEDPAKVQQYLLNLVRAEARRVVQHEKLEPLLGMSDDLTDRVTEALSKSEDIRGLGLELNALYFSAVLPKPEIAKALEAGYRESLLQKADEASYARRTAGVEQERKIREAELATQRSVELARAEIVELEGKNLLQTAEYKAQAAERELRVFQGMDASLVMAHGIYHMGLNAAKIGSLSLTPEILTALGNYRK